MSGQARARVVVTVDEEHRHMIGKVASELEDAGLREAQVLAELGVIAGEAEAACLTALRTVSGVQGVELDEEMRAI